MNTKIVRMIVAGTNGQGEPDFFFLKISCSQEQYDNGDHYAEAKSIARESGYEGPFVAFDEHDHALRGILDHFVWDSADTYDIEP